MKPWNQSETSPRLMTLIYLPRWHLLSLIKRIWLFLWYQTKARFDNKKLNIAWETLNVNWKKYLEEAHFSVKPHNSITNEEFVSQKTHLAFLHYYHNDLMELRHALAKKVRETPFFKQRCHLSGLVKYWGSLPGTTTKGKVKLYIKITPGLFFGHSEKNSSVHKKWLRSKHRWLSV